MNGDRTLMAFHGNALQYLRDILDNGFDDLPELSRKLAGLREEIDTLEQKACQIAGEQAERCAEPMFDDSFVASFNAVRR